VSASPCVASTTTRLFSGAPSAAQHIENFTATYQDELEKVRKRQAEREAEKARREEELVRAPPSLT
jgi:hypothetical protein